MVSFEETLMYKRFRPNSIMSTKTALHNVQGWLQSATTLTLFAEAHQLQDETVNFIHHKAKSMIITAKRVTRNLNRQEKNRISIKDHLQNDRSEEHTSELQSRGHLVCRLLLEKKNKQLILL